MVGVLDNPIIITNLLYVGVITKIVLFNARDSSGILPMKLESAPYFLLKINLISLGDTANGPTLSFFIMSLNACNQFIKMKGLRLNSRTRFHSHTVMRCAQIVVFVFILLLTLLLRCAQKIALILPLRSNLPDCPAAFYFHVIACYIAGSIAQ